MTHCSGRQQSFKAFRSKEGVKRGRQSSRLTLNRRADRHLEVLRQIRIEYPGALHLVSTLRTGPFPGGRVDEWSPVGRDDIDGRPEGRVRGRRTSQIVKSFNYTTGQSAYHHYD